MNQMEFTKKVSFDEADRQCKEITKSELEKLNVFIKENPNSLKPKDILDDLESSDEYDEESEESDHYFHHIANPDKVISMKDLQINRLEKRIYFQTLELSNVNLNIEELNKNFDKLKSQKLKLENQDQFIKGAIKFMKTEFNMSEIKPIRNFKDTMLDKAMEIAEIKKSFNELINWKDIDETIKCHFIPLIESKYAQIYSTYATSCNDNPKYATLTFITIILFLALFICNWI